MSYRRVANNSSYFSSNRLRGQVFPVRGSNNTIKNRVLDASSGFDIAIVEIGGTVGDIESQPFIEAIRQMMLELPSSSTALAHLTLVPYIKVCLLYTSDAADE